MRKQFIQASRRDRALKLCPWASYAIKVSEGYMCFESYDDYMIEKNAK